MNETQLLNVALSTVPTMVVVMIGILINNARLGDLRDGLANRISDTRDVLRAEMAKGHSEVLIKFSDLEHRMGGLEHRMDGLEHRMDRLEHRMDRLEHRMDGLEHHMDGLDHRIARIESALGMKPSV